MEVHVFALITAMLNDITKKDQYPLPRIADMLSALSGMKWFSSLDAASGYWQIPVEERDIPKTAFLSTEGLFEWTVMPFGLCNAPATYQRMMQDILGSLIWTECLVYLDDVLVFGRTFDEHQERLHRVVHRLFDAGLLLKAKKCMFGARSTTFLGHVVSSEGIGPDPKKVEKIKNFPIPRNPKELRSFLGLGSYYRRYIKDFGRIAVPLHKLTEKDATFTWAKEHKAAFQQIRDGISQAVVQGHPDFSKPFIVDADASEIGAGCILSQRDKEGREVPILMDSRKFTAAESKWHIREKEALGIIYALEQ